MAVPELEHPEQTFLEGASVEYVRAGQGWGVEAHIRKGTVAKSGKWMTRYDQYDGYPRDVFRVPVLLDGETRVRHIDNSNLRLERGV